MTGLVEHFEALLPELLADIETMLACESPSTDLETVSRSAGVVAAMGSRLLGVAPARIVLEGRSHLRWRLAAGPPRVLLLGHPDTVWPLGSVTTHPVLIENGMLRGPGCFDMKAGLAMAFYAVAALDDAAGVTNLATGDEGLGSPSSRALIEFEAAGCDAVLVLEAAAEGGALKCERKRVSRYEVHMHWRAAHAGLEPEAGVNATVEIAHPVLATLRLAAPERGTTVTPKCVNSGTSTNTVLASGRFDVDVRVATDAEQARVDVGMRSLTPAVEGATLEILGGPNRPPLAANASEHFFGRAVEVAAGLGLGAVRGVAVGGASEGNFTASIGVATLDGLGAIGGGAHADDDHVAIAELAPRTALLSALVADLLGGSVEPGSANAASTPVPEASGGRREVGHR